MVKRIRKKVITIPKAIDLIKNNENIENEENTGENTEESGDTGDSYIDLEPVFTTEQLQENISSFQKQFTEDVVPKQKEVITKVPEDFTYKVEKTDFQKSLQDIFKDVDTGPEPETDNTGLHKVESLNTPSPDNLIKDTKETVDNFNDKLRNLISNRNKVVDPQSYIEPEEKKVVDLQNINSESNIIRNLKNISNRNITVTSSRSNGPTNRSNNKVSSNR
jgi:hypothetical protein